MPCRDLHELTLLLLLLRELREIRVAALHTRPRTGVVHTTPHRQLALRPAAGSATQLVGRVRAILEAVAASCADLAAGPKARRQGSRA